MFWVALSAFIMSVTGTGDDTYAIRKFFERAREAVATTVADPERRRAAELELERAGAAFTRHRRRVGVISQCIEHADRRYGATAADYERCLKDVEAAWNTAASELVGLERGLRQSLTPEELTQVRRAAEPR
jgi:hypothetical protein